MTRIFLGIVILFVTVFIGAWAYLVILLMSDEANPKGKP